MSRLALVAVAALLAVSGAHAATPHLGATPTPPHPHSAYQHFKGCSYATHGFVIAASMSLVEYDPAYCQALQKGLGGKEVSEHGAGKLWCVFQVVGMKTGVVVVYSHRRSIGKQECAWLDANARKSLLLLETFW